MKVTSLGTIFTMTLILGCSSHEELPPPDNPFDPGNPDYLSPTVEIISGPSESEIIDVTTVTFEWQGNESATEYSYQFDGSDWSEWSTRTSEEFDYLDEGDHIFRVQARSINGDAQETSTALNFSVDAVAGPSALVYPYKHVGNPGDTLIYQIIAEEVLDLFAVECHIEIDDDLELIDIIDGNLQSEWGGNPLVIQEITGQTILLSIVSVEGTNTSFAGTTSILTLKLRVKSTTLPNIETTALIISNLQYLNATLNTLNISTIRQGVLDVR
jgi:hypothetical protein